MAADQAPAEPLTPAERRLALAGYLLFATILAVGIALWLGFGESVYVARILGGLASCF